MKMDDEQCLIVASVFTGESPGARPQTLGPFRAQSHVPTEPAQQRRVGSHGRPRRRKRDRHALHRRVSSERRTRLLHHSTPSSGRLRFANAVPQMMTSSNDVIK